MNSRFNLPLRIYFFLGAVRVHVVELVLLMPVTDRICVDVMGVADIGADSHLVSQGRLNSSWGVGCCLGGQYPSDISSFKLRLQKCVVDSVEAVLTVVV